MDGSISRWFDREIAGCSLADRRLTKRLRSLLERMGDAMGASIPLACQDWANTKAYRFFSNQRISEAEILAGHFDATRERFAATEGAPLGLAAVKFWTREKFKGTVALKKKINPTRVPIEGKESIRWLENLRQSTALFGDPARCMLSPVLWLLLQAPGFSIEIYPRCAGATPIWPGRPSAKRTRRSLTTNVPGAKARWSRQKCPCPS